MNVQLEKLTMGTVFTYKGMTLRKASSCGPCDPVTNKLKEGGGKGTEYGRSCDLKIGGEWQTNPELQVWVPNAAVVEVR